MSRGQKSFQKLLFEFFGKSTALQKTPKNVQPESADPPRAQEVSYSEVRVREAWCYTPFIYRFLTRSDDFLRFTFGFETPQNKGAPALT